MTLRVPFLLHTPFFVLFLVSFQEHLEFLQSLHGCTIPRVTPTPSVPHPHPVYHTHTQYTTPTPSIPHPHPVYHTHTQYTTPTRSITHCKSHRLSGLSPSSTTGAMPSPLPTVEAICELPVRTVRHITAKDRQVLP